jgi:hypothetical protein
VALDEAFARKRFADYLQLWATYMHESRDPWRQDRVPPLREEIIRTQPTIGVLLEACGERVSRIGTSGATYKEHRQAILRAQGTLDDRPALERALGPGGPEVRAYGLHEWVWETAASLWDSGHYRQAVAAAAGNVSRRVQSKLDRWDLADDALMTEALTQKPPAVGKPRLRVPATPGRPFEEALQTGALFFARGIYSLLRNPATHNVDEEWSEQRALEGLAAISVLARALDAATVEVAD